MQHTVNIGLRRPLSGAGLLITILAATSIGAPRLSPFAGKLTGRALPPQQPLTLWYRQPATEWTSALPVANGQQAGMIFGGIDSDLICLNYASLWSGGPYSPENPDAFDALGPVRQLLFDGKYKEAEHLISARMMGRPATQAPYQALGDVLLNFPKVDDAVDYHRDLDLTTATAKVAFSPNGTTFSRELFASAPDHVLVLHLSASKPGQINFHLALRTGQVICGDTGTDDTLILDGKNRGFANVPGKLTFQVRMKILHDGGMLIRTQQPAGNPATGPAVDINDPRPRRPGGPPVVDLATGFSLTNADSATILITSATSYKNYHDVSADPASTTTECMDRASTKGFDALLQSHLADYQRLFNRVSLDLGTGEGSNLPTDDRIAAFAAGHDSALPALYFQYGRYLLIESSRPGGQPANLQGIWNGDNSPAWGSKYTININTEMNYWPVNTTNLTECIAPLLAMVQDLQVTGTATAKNMYHARGWVAHHNTDLWRASAPIDYPASGMWPLGGAWLCNTLWDHYEFTQDRAFLQKLYPAMKGAAEFFQDTLVEEPTHRRLITSPSLSPENPHPGGGSVVAGPTCDRQMLRDLFAHCIDAATVLGVDKEFTTQLAVTRDRLAPNQIGSAGQLQEWLADWDTSAPEPHNRHVSHLYGLYPGEDISFEQDHDLTAAVRKSLEMRGDDATGWGLGWRLNLWARLHDGAHAYKILQNLLAAAKPRSDSRDRSGVYNNLFDAHPPFQIDGNFGGTAGICEMLVQSTAPRADRPAVIEFLPALPPQWPSGKVSGLRARGNLEVSLQWKELKLVAAAVHNLAADALVNLKYGNKSQQLSLKANETKRITFDQ